MFQNRPLTNNEIDRLNKHYKTIISHYTKVTDRPFMRDELIVLKLLCEITTPAVINNMITRFYKQYPENFQTLNYIYTPVKNMFKNKKRGVRNNGKNT